MANLDFFLNSWGSRIYLGVAGAAEKRLGARCCGPWIGSIEIGSGPTGLVAEAKNYSFLNGVRIIPFFPVLVVFLPKTC